MTLDSAPVPEVVTGPQRLAQSHEYCRQLTRAAAKNFYYGLRLLPEPKRSAMFALYAYMRLVDDIADDDQDGRSIEQREQDLESWRLRTHAAAVRREVAGDAQHDIWPAFAELVQRYQMPLSLFDGVIAGQQADLRAVEPANFEQLREYCYLVAGVVGLASIRIWGYEGGEETEQLAIARGVAFQLTNILRDVREDARRGRIYFPREDLLAMNISEEELLACRGGEKFCELMRFQIERAESFFQASAPLVHRVQRDSRPTLVAMTEIYHGLLRKISDDPERVLHERISLSVLSKLRIGWRAVRASRRRPVVVAAAASVRTL
jgi:phytoene synthase